MQREIVIPGAMHYEWRRYLLQDHNVEQAAFFLAGVQHSAGRVRLLCREMIPVPAEAFTQQTATFLSIKPEFTRSLLQRCRNEGLSLIESHSHPFADHDVTFSAIDKRNEASKFAYTAAKIPGIHHASIVLGRQSLDAHLWDAQRQSVTAINAVRLIEAPLQTLIPTSAQPSTPLAAPPPDARMTRQVLAFGAAGQQRIAACRVAVVGCGGTGSLVIEQLAHLGVRDFVLIDPDLIEISNLNRVVGTTPGDALQGNRKVVVMQRLIRQIAPAAQIEAVAESIFTHQALKASSQVDVILGCVDNDAARLALNQLAVQYLIPYIDLGTGLVAESAGLLSRAGGQVRVVLPCSGFCLECIDGINRQRAQEMLLSQVEQAARQARGYGLGNQSPAGLGNQLPAPSVIFVNAMIASCAVGEFLNLLTGYKPPQFYLQFDLLQMKMQAIKAARRVDCICCGENGGLALGDNDELGWRIPEQSHNVPIITKGGRNG